MIFKKIFTSTYINVLHTSKLFLFYIDEWQMATSQVEMFYKYNIAICGTRTNT